MKKSNLIRHVNVLSRLEFDYEKLEKKLLHCVERDALPLNQIIETNQDSVLRKL